MKGNHFTTDDLPLDEIYDYGSEERERADREIEAIEKDEFFEVPSLDKAAREEEIMMNLMNESLKKIHEIMGLPRHETDEPI